MKKKIIIAVIMVFTTLTAQTTQNDYVESINIEVASNFCDGWEDGYCEGWRDVKGQFAVCPVAPVCPIPEVNRDRYRDGYNRGFKAGSRAANKN